jgi:hypothetical protein
MKMRQLAQTPEAVPFSAATEYGKVDSQTWDADKVTLLFLSIVSLHVCSSIQIFSLKASISSAVY